MGRRTKRVRHGATAGPAVRPESPPRRSRSDDTVGVVVGIAGTLLGLSVGYMIGTQLQDPTIADISPTSSPAAVAQTRTDATLVDQQAVAALREILARDPDNLTANIALGDRYYDARQYTDAVPFYRAAIQLDPNNADVSTDLGTALYYSGRPDEAMTQFEHSLSVDATHAQTLFNIGIVALEGQGDPQRAVESWERLLSTHPTYPGRDRVEALVARARGLGGDR